MYQEIVFCKTIFEKIIQLFEGQEIWDSKFYYQNLQLKKILTLPTNEDLIKKAIGQCEGFRKIFKNHIWTAGKLNFETPNAQTKLNENSNLSELLNLAFTSESKILHSEHRKIQDPPADIEIANINDFNNPSSHSRLLAIKRSIKISKGNVFKFDSILLFYFKYTKSIAFSDKFIRKREAGYINLKRFLRMCTQLKNVSIYTDTRDSSEQNKYFIQVKDMEEELLREFSINPRIKPTSQHQRKITTDEFEITIDPGLDFLNESYVAEKQNVDIQIKIIKE